MAEDWAADVKKYVPDADDGVIAAIVKYCGIALRNRDSSLVAMTDPKETARVRENYLKKKLGLTHSDADLDGAIQSVGQRMKGDNTKNRVTVYYLLLEHFGKFDLFGGKAAAAVAGAAAASVAGLASLGTDAKETAADAAGSLGAGAAAAGAAVAGAAAVAAPLTGSYGSGNDSDDKGGLGWLWWLLLGLLALALLWWLFFRGDGGAQAPAATEAAAPASSEAAAPAEAAPSEGTVAIPDGAGITTETRDGKPVVKVYFDTGKTDVVPAFGPAAAGLKAYLDANAGSSLAVSGFNDPTGNAAANAELSKNRAVAVKAELVKSGIADASVALVKPEATTDTATNLEGARRVEVTVK